MSRNNYLCKRSVWWRRKGPSITLSQEKIFTIDETHFFWQSGDYITPIHPYNIKQEENALEAPSTTLASDLPEWLDNYIFNILNAKYSPDHVRFEYNLNLSKEEVLIYLGTYFPRSYIEINSLFTDFLNP